MHTHTTENVILGLEARDIIQRACLPRAQLIDLFANFFGTVGMETTAAWN